MLELHIDAGTEHRRRLLKFCDSVFRLILQSSGPLMSEVCGQQFLIVLVVFRRSCSYVTCSVVELDYGFR